MKTIIFNIINFYETFKFFILKKDCKVIYFNIPSHVLYAYINRDMVSYVSNLIDNKDTKLIKLAWLIQELKNKPQKNPLQLLKCGTKYQCHPGTDRVVVLCYILEKPIITGFYLWYPKIDQTPMVLDYDHTIISNPFTFLSKFNIDNLFLFQSIRLDNDVSISDVPESAIDSDMDSNFSIVRIRQSKNAMFRTAKKCFTQTVSNFNVRFLTYADTSHRTGILDSIHLDNILIFTNENTCYLAGIRFDRVNNLWIQTNAS